MRNKLNCNWLAFWGFLLALSLISIIAFGISVRRADYKYEKKFLYAWNLSDKSSTIEAKAKYITEFVNTLKEYKTQFADNNAIFFCTPDNSFDNNLAAIETLKGRLESIQKMDPASFQYNTAIEQITKQEQGEAHRLLYVIQGCYYLQTYPLLWGWIFQIVMGILAVVLLVSIVGICFLIDN